MAIDNICALQEIKTLKDNSQDLIFADPPYALGSAVLIGKDGKPYYKEARDFLNSWEMPDEKFWEEFYTECMRVLKYGGRVLFFGIDRQLFLFQYYAVASGLEIKQSLYYYFISNFPKSTDLSKNIDKRLGVEREVVGKSTSKGIRSGAGNYVGDVWEQDGHEITKPSSDLGKKYEGLKYSISPLKQVLEHIMVFQKPTKNKSILDDVFAYENGDDEISVSAWNIDGGRVPTSEEMKTQTAPDLRDVGRISKEVIGQDKLSFGQVKDAKRIEYSPSENGRFPSQLFIDEECANRLDEQSGIKVGSDSARKNKKDGDICYGAFKQIDSKGHKDSGGASKILHKIGYLDEELDLLIYDSKVSTWEREYGCDGFSASYHSIEELTQSEIKEIENYLN